MLSGFSLRFNVLGNEVLAHGAFRQESIRESDVPRSKSLTPVA
jgi:hypothetical protein